MNKYQKEAFKNVAEDIEYKLREEGYMSLDILSVAYFLLENNIEKSEKLVSSEDNISDLLNRAENILKIN